MHDPRGVRTSEGATNLGNDLGSLAQRQTPSFVETLEQVLAVKQLHDDEGMSLVDSMVENLNDVSTAKLRGSRCFTLEAFPRVFTLSEFGIDELDSDRRVEGQMIGNPHSPLRTLPERSDEPITIAQDSAYL